MSTAGRARVQYGKASKRIKDVKASDTIRADSENAAEARVERKTQAQHAGSQVAAAKSTALNEVEKDSTHGKKSSAGPSTRSRASASRSPTRGMFLRISYSCHSSHFTITRYSVTQTKER